MHQRLLSHQRVTRLVEFGAVGAVGMVVDLSVVAMLLESTHYLLANLAGFAVAVTFNFAGNWWLTFDRPDGHLGLQYLSYVALHGVTFLARAGVVFALVAGAGGPAEIATLAGVGVAALLNFLGSERILVDDREWLDAVAALNSAAHAVYSSRLRALLRATGLYDLCYRAYMQALQATHSGQTMAVSAGGQSAELLAREGSELVSITHTTEKEGAVLERFVSAVEPDDVVWDVGANVGVYAALAGRAGDSVVAVEPVSETAHRCAKNLGRNDVDGRVIEGALGAHAGTMPLAIDRAEVGTQRPELASAGERHVDVIEGDSVEPAPDIIKIDVEGAELDAMAGLESHLDTARHVLVESHDHDRAVASALQTAGFDVDTVDVAGQTYLFGDTNE